MYQHSPRIIVWFAFLCLVHLVPCVAGAQSTPSVELIGLEVTQAIQEMDNAHPSMNNERNNTVPLIAGKDTYVRAYFKNVSGSDLTISATLKGSTADSVLSVDSSYLSQTATVKNTRNIDLAKLRDHIDINGIDCGLMFKLTDAWTAEGDLTLAIDKDSIIGADGSQIRCLGCDKTVTVRFYSMHPLRIKLIRFSYSRDRAYVLDNNDLKDIQGLLEQAYPVPEVEREDSIEEEERDLGDGQVLNDPITCDLIKIALTEIRQEDFGRHLPTQKFHYIGLVPDGGFYQNGQLDQNWGCSPPLEKDPNPHDRDPLPYAISYVPVRHGTSHDTAVLTAHELGHTFGLKHPRGVCIEDSPFDENFPPQGMLDLKGNHVGVDGSKAFPGTETYDFMTYCTGSPRWISSYSHCTILRRLLEENNEEDDELCSAPAGIGSVPAYGVPVLVSDPPSLPFSQKKTPSRRPSSKPPVLLESGPFLGVIVNVDTMRKTAAIKSMRILPFAVPSPALLDEQCPKGLKGGEQEERPEGLSEEEPGQHLHKVTIQLKIEGGQDICGTVAVPNTVQDFGLVPPPAARLDDRPSAAEVVEFMLPLEENQKEKVREVYVHFCNRLAQAFQVSAHAPVVTAIEMKEIRTAIEKVKSLEELTELSVSWTANDADPQDKELTYRVEISTDNRTTWHTIVKAYKKTELKINTAFIARSLRDSRQIEIKVTASDGFNTSEEKISERVELQKQQ